MEKIKDRDIQKALKEMTQLKGNWERYEELQQRVKESLREYSPGEYETDDWTIKVSAATKTEYQIPDDIAAKLRKQEDKIKQTKEEYAVKVPATPRVSMDVKT